MPGVGGAGVSDDWCIRKQWLASQGHLILSAQSPYKPQGDHPTPPNQVCKSLAWAGRGWGHAMGPWANFFPYKQHLSYFVVL